MGFLQMMISFSLSTELGLWFLEFARSIERVDESIRSVLPTQRSIILRRGGICMERDLNLKQKLQSSICEDKRGGDVPVDELEISRRSIDFAQVLVPKKSLVGRCSTSLRSKAALATIHSIRWAPDEIN